MKINQKNLIPVLLAVWVVAAVTSVKAQLIGSLQQNASIPFHEGVRIGKLPNGMEYYLLKNAKPEKRCEIRLALKAGSIVEDDDQQGIAHFVEHMCFNGSKNFKKNELVNYLEKTGTKFGADLNAFTSFDETVYMLEVRTDDKEIFDKGLLVMEDWAGGVSFENEEIDKERGVVESEWRTRLSPSQRMQNRYFPVIYAGSQYANRLPIGQMDIIRKAPYDNFKRFYRDWYRPDLMALVIVGDFDLDAVENHIKSRFSALKNPSNPRPRKEFEVPKHKNTLVSICSDKEASSTTVQIMYNHDYQKPVNIKDYRQSFIFDLYNQMINARLGEISQRPEPPFSFAFSSYGSDVGSTAKYTSFASTRDGGAMTALKTVLEENERVKKFGFTQTELERMKKQIEKSVESGYKEKDKTLSRNLVMGIVYHFLDQAPFLSPTQELDVVKSILPTITIEDVNACARRFITDENRIVVITSPEKPEIKLPTEAEVLNLVNTAKELRLEPYVDKVSTVPLMQTMPVKGSVVKEERNSSLGTITWQLSNGATVTLKPTTFKNDEILFSATSQGGSYLYSEADNNNASYAAQVITTSGIGTFDQISLEKYLTGKELGISPYIGSYREGMNGATSVEDQETFFQLLYLYFTQPRLDKEAFASFKSKRMAMLKNVLSDPQRYFNIESNKIKTNNHPRTKFTTAEDIDKLDLDRVFSIYKERFSNAGDFAFFFTGSFTPESIKPLIEQYIASLPSSGNAEKMKDQGVRYPEGVVQKSWSKGTAPKSNVDITFHTPFEMNDRNRYVFQSMIEVLKIKLRETLREDKGGVYGVSVSGSARKFPKTECNITISFNCTPGNEQNLIDATMQVLNKAKAIGAEDADLIKVKETQRQERIKSLEQNNFWNSSLVYCFENDINAEMVLMQNYEKLINSLSAEDLKQACNQYIDENSMIKITSNPEPEVIKP
jgi:zinc protease